jgi:hypothetical protein
LKYNVSSQDHTVNVVSHDKEYMLHMPGSDQQ